MIYEFFKQGGYWMIPILVISVIGVAFILERGWYWLQLWLRADHRLRRRLVLGDRPAPGLKTRDPHASVLLTLVRNREDEDVALDRARSLVRESREHLKVLAIVAGLGSAMGLFGTVMGMRDSFKGVGLSDSSGILEGLYGALNTTVLGLFVYVTCYTAHAFFAQQSTNLGADLEEDLNQVRRALTKGKRR